MRFDHDYGRMPTCRRSHIDSNRVSIISQVQVFKLPITPTTTKSRIEYRHRVHTIRKKNFVSRLDTAANHAIVGHERPSDRYLHSQDLDKIGMVGSRSGPFMARLCGISCPWAQGHLNRRSTTLLRWRRKKEVQLCSPSHATNRAAWTGCYYPYCLKSTFLHELSSLIDKHWLPNLTVFYCLAKL